MGKSAKIKRRLRKRFNYDLRVWRDRTLWDKFITPFWFLLSAPFMLCSRPLDWCMNARFRYGKVGEVEVIPWDSSSYVTFGRVTTEALLLVGVVDPRRYRRIQREIRLVKDLPFDIGARYIRIDRECQVNFSKFKCDWSDPSSSEYEWYLAQYAATLVHEATHGYLISRGVPYTQTIRAFCERMCVTEERRFAQRLHGKHYNLAEELVEEFDPERWRNSWNRTKWQRTKADWREAFKKTDKE